MRKGWREQRGGSGANVNAPRDPPRSVPLSRRPRVPAGAAAVATSTKLVPRASALPGWAGLGVDTLLFLLVHPRQGWNFPVEVFTRQLKGKTKAKT